MISFSKFSLKYKQLIYPSTAIFNDILVELLLHMPDYFHDFHIFYLPHHFRVSNVFISLLNFHFVSFYVYLRLLQKGGEHIGRSLLITGVLMSGIAHPRGTLAVSCRLSSRGELIPPISRCHVDRRGDYVSQLRRRYRSRTRDALPRPHC